MSAKTDKMLADALRRLAAVEDELKASVPACEVAMIARAAEIRGEALTATALRKLLGLDVESDTR